MSTEEEQIRKDIAENVAMQAYFKEFEQKEVDSFLRCYIRKKSVWLDRGGRYIGQQDEDALQWVNRTSRHLEIIQQKKLFDLQCQWRAEKIQLPDVLTTVDFLVWEHNILNCAFLAPATTDDIELYAKYLLQENPDTRDPLYAYYERWQKHNEIVKAYNTNNENRNFPGW